MLTGARRYLCNSLFPEIMVLACPKGKRGHSMAAGGVLGFDLRAGVVVPVLVPMGKGNQGSSPKTWGQRGPEG